MKPLEPDEKITTVMVYTQDMLVRGDVVTKENMRVSIWLRTQGVANYLHLHSPQVISFSGLTPKTLSYGQIFIPIPQVVGFHIAPPSQDPLDYDSSETNRLMQPAELLIGSFHIKAKFRFSTQTDIANSLEVMRVSWASVYEADISNPQLPQLAMHVPMLLINPNQVSIALV